MPDLVDLLIEDDRWLVVPLATLGEKAARAAFACLDMAADGFELTLLACSDHRIAGLNEEFREKAKPTNVLSWPSDERGAEQPGGQPSRPQAGSDDDPESLGDIAIAWETVEREAAEGGIPLDDHVTHLIVHAVLHLLGYDHEDDRDAELMEGLEVKALASIGLPDPYARQS
ncbi:MAG: rRNA maturation RNase YbeY [Deltaproteobacteria bacterium]